jgi:hypothetical protein
MSSLHKTSIRLALFAGAICLTGTPAAHAGSTFLFDANQTYSSASNSAFAGASDLHLENFEDGLVNTAGLTVNHGKIKGPGGSTDSVDGDDGKLNKKGNKGHSFSSGSFKSITFNFASQDGQGPTAAGIVFTDGKANARITFKAWDTAGNYLGKIKVKLGDLVRNGTTGEDRFFGLTSESGISRIQIASNQSGFEVDHVQFAYNFAVVPLPPALGLGIAGLAAVGLWRRRRRCRPA